MIIASTTVPSLRIRPLAASVVSMAVTMRSVGWCFLRQVAKIQWGVSRAVRMVAQSGCQ